MGISSEWVQVLHQIEIIRESPDVLHLFSEREKEHIEDAIYISFNIKIGSSQNISNFSQKIENFQPRYQKTVGPHF